MSRLGLLVLFVGCVLAAPASGIDLTATTITDGSPPDIRLVMADQRAVVFEVELTELSTGTVTADGRTFDLIAIPEGGIAGGPGEPAIPVLTKLLAVPAGAEIRTRVEVLAEEVIEGKRLLPVQDEASDRFDYALEAYARRGYGDEPTVEVGEPAILRDVRVVPLVIRPVAYDPAGERLRVVQRMRVEIDILGEFDASSGPVRRRAIPPSFDRLYRQLIVNYTGPGADQTIAPGSNLMICIDNSTIVDLVTPLVEWRNRKGNPTTLVTVGFGVSRTEIKSYIQAMYDDLEANLEYVTLVGDVGHIPCWYETVSWWYGEGDHPYTQLDGGDVLSEIHIGRLSFGSNMELERIVNKILGYERTPDLSEPEWFTRACVVGDPYDSGYSTVMTGQWLKERLIGVGYTQVDTIWSSPFVSQMLTALNRGDTIFGYRGFGGMSGWSSGTVYQLTNQWQMPFTVILTCETGSFANGTARSESFLRAGSGTNEPDGAIGAIGTATPGTHTRYNNCMYYGIFRGLLQEGQHTMGAALTRGKVEMYLNYQLSQPDKVYLWSHWNNLMGDPLVDVWSGFPVPLDVQHPASIALGTNVVSVTVGEGATPVEGALVCLWKAGETQATGYTDAAGRIDLPISVATNGILALTVTGHDKHPYLADIMVADHEVYVGYSGVRIDDDMIGTSSGNGDENLNPLETVELQVELRNFGTSAATIVSAELSSADPYVTIIDGDEFYGTIGGGLAVWSADDYDIAIAGDCPHGHVLRLDLDITSGVGNSRALIELEVLSADLLAQGTTLYGAGGNGLFDPGESIEMSVSLLNQGELAASGMTGTLVSLSPFVTVVDANGTFGDIGIGGAGENVGDLFGLSADSFTPAGHLAGFRLVSSFSGGVSDTTEVVVPVGQRSSDDPAGPDRYGYYAFDNTDTSYPEAPVYAWVEIDPAHGGDGELVTLGDYGSYQDKSRVVDLPFTFQYYGQQFDEATVCSNGWLAMGSTYLVNYRNWTIPGAGGPRGMIAAFWDDLYQYGGANAYQKYDVAGGRWIIEWSRFRNRSNGSTDTFQIILYDPAVHPTLSGDGVIVIQYEAVYNYDPTNGYATVGIESPDQLDGLLYTYWNQYAGGAALLAAGRAIRFTPLTAPPTTSAGAAAASILISGLDRPHPNPFNPSTTITYRLAAPEAVRLSIFDVAGRHVRTLLDGPVPAGEHVMGWDGRDTTGRAVGSGTYFLRLQSDRLSEVRRLVLIR